MKVAVTGGSGVVGSAVVRHLVAAGHDVWALARSPAASATLDAIGAHVVHGDILDEAAVMRLVKASRWVFHIAGVNELCSRDPARMWLINVEAVTGMLEACQRAGVERLIHTSSAATIGEEHGTVGFETSPHRGHFLSEYERSKTVAERLLFNTTSDVEVVSVNPSSVQGPGRVTGTGALLLASAKGSMPLMVDTNISLVDIDDSARGHLLAAQKGEPGERYLLSGTSLTTREIVRRLNDLRGRRRSPWYIERRAVTGLAPLVHFGFRLVGKQAPLCPESARVLLHGHCYDGSKASRELGLSYTPVDETLERTFRWFRREGLI